MLHGEWCNCKKYDPTGVFPLNKLDAARKRIAELEAEVEMLKDIETCS